MFSRKDRDEAMIAVESANELLYRLRLAGLPEHDCMRAQFEFNKVVIQLSMRKWSAASHLAAAMHQGLIADGLREIGDKGSDSPFYSIVFAPQISGGDTKAPQRRLALEAVKSCVDACPRVIPSAANLEWFSDDELFEVFEDLITFLLTDERLGAITLVEQEDRDLVSSILQLIYGADLESLHHAARQALEASQRKKHYHAMNVVVFTIVSLQEPSSLGDAMKSLSAELYQRSIRQLIDKADEQGRFLNSSELEQPYGTCWSIVAETIEQILSEQLSLRFDGELP